MRCLPPRRGARGWTRSDPRGKRGEGGGGGGQSQAATRPYLVGLGYRQTSDLPITVIRQPHNLGYGGNQKAGYRYAIDHGFDIVVLLHGDGQYAPESLPQIVAPLEHGECDAVFGSRMIVKGAARKGGMPLYKFVGNRILLDFENAALGTDLSEFHSGYRAYSVDALADVPFEQNSDGFNFDTQIIIQLRHAGKRINEVPIPTYYGDEICHVNGMQYAWDVTRDVVSLQAPENGLRRRRARPARRRVRAEGEPGQLARRIFALLASRPAGNILDLGCSSGLLAQRLRELGHRVTGVDAVEAPGVREQTDSFVKADLDAGIPAEVGTGFDVVLAADVIEHLRDPQRLVRESRRVLRPGGSLVVCVPNFGHWYPRLRAARPLRLRPAWATRPRPSALLHPPERKAASRARGFEIRRIEPVGLLSKRSRSHAPATMASGFRFRRGFLVADPVRLSVHPRGRAHDRDLRVSGWHRDEDRQHRDEERHGEPGDRSLRPLAGKRGRQHEHEQRCDRQRVSPGETGIVDVIGDHHGRAEGDATQVEHGHRDQAEDM